MIPDGAMLIAGAARVEPTRRKTAAANGSSTPSLTIDDAGEITGAADKVHLVPFGEYLPFQRTGRDGSACAN